MKKLLMVFMAFVGITCTAMAEPKDYRNSGGYLCARTDTMINRADGKPVYKFDGAPYSYVKIFFETGHYDFHDGCEEIYRQLAKDLAKVKDYVGSLVFIGMADNQGGLTKDNVDLSDNRANALQKLYNEVRGGGYSWTKYVAGSADAQEFSRKDDDPEFRAVDLYVIWKSPYCDEKTMTKINNVKTALAGYSGEHRSELDMAFDKLNKLCANANDKLTLLDDNEYKRAEADLIAILQDVVKEMEKDPGNSDTVYVVQGNINALLIDSYFRNLDSILGQSVWRDKDGKFNAARLASDSIAGVVLGTAGGLITSHLVKKGQIKEGFENLNCTIGGQRVAGWGDEFTVGIQ